MEIGLKYDLNLPEKVSNILSTDFWVLEQFNKAMLPDISTPVKFTSNVSVLVKNGSCIADINLISHQISSPGIVNIRRTQILQLRYVSDDFEASFIVMSKRFSDNLFLLLQDCRVYSTALRHQVVYIHPNQLKDYENLYSRISRIFSDTSNPFGYQAMTLALSSFFYECAYKCYMPLMENYPIGHNRVPERFLNLVQKHFKKERFLKFYAEKLDLTPKHLSRTMKNLTGFTAVEWIERYVVLEAKVMLKASNLNIQQISDELNFPSQSFFGKYFKKNVGMSPKEFRNS